jgi:two-component system sensor histidine kinase TctE
MLAVLLPGMLAIIGVELWLTRSDAIDAANAAFDRSLHGAIKSVELNVSTASGGLAVELPYRLFEFFQLTARGNVYFRVATADGLVEIGSPDLPQPPEPASPDVPVFYDAVYFGEPVRVGTYVRKLDRPLSGGGVQQLMIQVAESVASRRAFTRTFVVQAAVRDALVISMIGMTLAILVTLLLRPVSRLAAQVAARQPSDLRPLDARDLPRDIQPLVDAVNEQLTRTRGLMERQRIFLDDASHQLRTPLATLHAQVGYALRQRGGAEVTSTLRSIHRQLEDATRNTNQLLALARSDAAALNWQDFDLHDLLREVATRLLPLARAKALDFGVDVPEVAYVCSGDPALLAEAIGNLAHNAIAYSRLGGHVTLSASAEPSSFSVAVENTGPPIHPTVLANLGERFVKSEDSRGAGLGLAIARSIIERHGGALSVRRLDESNSNRVVMTWPNAGAERP